MHCDLEDCSEMAKVPGSSASTNSSSDIRMNNTNEGEQGEVVNNVAGNFFKKVFNVGGDFKLNLARGRGGLPCVLIAGVLIAGVLIACVLMLKHIKLSHDGKVAGKVAVDASLSATADNNSSWLSPSGVFAFGFRQLENSDQFLLCIWFANILDRTIVWYANGDSPAPKGSTVKLVAKSGLVLTSPQSEQLWNQTIAGVVAHGVMYDTGNFVLVDDKSESLWETFKNPTDTMLPGQIIERGGKLFSRQETNYARGRFQLEFQDDGNLVFSEETSFCSTRTTSGTVTGSEGYQLVFNDSGNFYILRNNNGIFPFTAEERPAKDFYLRSTLNFNGVLAQYYLSKSNVSNVSWAQLWFEPHQVDSGAGDCAGNCSNCYLNVSPRINCTCPSG